MQYRIFWRLSLAALAALTACEHGNDMPAEGRYVVNAIGGQPAAHDAAGRAVCENFTSRLTIKDRMNQEVAIFNPNEEIRFELAVTNHSGSSQTLFAGASCATAFFEVTDPNGTKLWNNIDGIFCVAAQIPLVYAPFETKTHAVVWQQDRRMQGNPPASQPSPLPECRSALSKSAEFSIR